ncbi:Solute carrier family 41 member 2-like protein [Dinothrombium tinctorium]|uniref:Solute carrier family 41 member 2-like protein n=1 Tax=Dinothrombium tinctorium TaxID=1965070 RepID=A0A3S3SKG5_9ACAR|nr:Solute carrier family 41 member 2-like protein [Dinothrombium tinctorium]
MSEADSSSEDTIVSDLRMETSPLTGEDVQISRSRHASFSLEPFKYVVDNVRRKSVDLLPHKLRPRSESFENPMYGKRTIGKKQEVISDEIEAEENESNYYEMQKPIIAFEKADEQIKDEDDKICITLPPKSNQKIDGMNGSLPKKEDYNVDDYESPFRALQQLLIPFLIAGLGNVATGYTLDHVKDWTVFHNVPQLVILVPALLGLKGNVEMTLASRLSTHANLGDLDHPAKRRQIIIGNMALVQCQACTVGFIAPWISLALSYLNPDENGDHVLTAEEIVLLSASSVITANIANLLLGSIMCLVVVISRKMNIDPDNIATPIAASLGDFTTMILLAYIADFLWKRVHIPLIPTISLLILLLLIPLWGHIARRVQFTRAITLTGWIPIICAMLLQNTGGLIMHSALDKFERLAAFQPVINGVGGNLVAVHSSRMSTYLHKNANFGQLPLSDARVCNYPTNTFCGPKSPHSQMARLLLYLSAPSHIFFLVVIKITRNHYFLTASFLFVYLTAAVTQVAILLHLAYILVHWTWSRCINPDNSVIPFLTAFADLIGSGLLAIAFFLLVQFNDPNAFENAEANALLESNATMMLNSTLAHI